MAKLWCISAPMLSHTDWGGFRKTAQLLRDRGHEVTWVSGERLRGVMDASGLALQVIDETGFLWPLPPPPDFTGMPPQEAMNLRYTRALDTWLTEDRVSAATAAILALADEIGPPDMILTDPFLSASALAAEKLGVKMVTMGWPAQGSFETQALFPIQRDLGSDSRNRITRLCEQFGIRGENFSQGATPSIISPHLHITYWTRDWYAAEDDTLLPQNVFAGGMPPDVHDEPPEWLAQIPAGIPLATVTLGTVFTGDLGFFSWGAQAAAREGLLPIVIIGFNPMQPDKKAELVRALPKGSRLVNFAPFHHLLPRTRLMIHHGGMGTTHAAVVHGVPQIVVPHAADQRVQAKRVAQAKVGLNLTAHDVRQGMLWEGVKALKDDETVRQTAQKLAREMAALGGPVRAADAVEAITG